MKKYFSRLLLLLPMTCPWYTASAVELKVAVAANFKPTLEILAKTFAEKTGHLIVISSASSGVLYNQILHGAPFDVFLSADAERPEQLEKQGLALPDSRQPYAFGALVLWRPTLDKNQKSDLTLDDLINYKGRLAIANPATAPYGFCAKQVLENLGVWQTFQPRLVKGASIAQTWQFVASGNAGGGLVARAQVMDQLYDKRRVLQIPANLYRPIRQDLVILKRTAEPEVAKELAQFLLSPASQQIVEKQGYIQASKANQKTAGQ